MEIGQRFNPWNMFVGAVIPNCIMELTDLSQTAKLCLARLHQYAGRKGECFPSVARLAEEVGVKRTAAKRAIQDLVDFGLLEKTGNTNDKGEHVSNSYFFLYHRVYEEAGQGGVGSKKTPPRSEKDPTGRVEKDPFISVVRESVVRDSDNTGAENDSAPVSLSGDKSKKATVPAAQLKTVLRAFWITLGKPQWSDNDRNRHRSAAKEILEYFIKYPIAGQDADASAVNCIEAVAASLDHEGMTWSAQAITRWMSNYKLQLDTWGEYKGIHVKVEPKGGEQ